MIRMIKTLKAVIYDRVSTDEQATEGYSIPAQIELLVDYAKRHNLTITDENIDNGKSGKSIAGPPQMSRLLMALLYLVRNLDSILEQADSEEKKELLRMIIKEIEITPSAASRKEGRQIHKIHLHFDFTPAGIKKSQKIS
jgi:hypothetical protein